MGDVVNLRRARKTKARLAATAHATEQRIRFGDTRATRELVELRERAAKALLDGAKLADAGDGPRPEE
jgi:Domain of unknown function (DUF4169)